MPMTFFAAAIWSTSALVVLDFLALILISAHPSSEIDLVSRVLCQAAAFVGTLFLLTLVHERERPLTDVLALRRASVPISVLSIALGFTLQGPMNLLSEAIYARYPLPEDQIDVIRQLFDVPLLHQKFALVVAAGIVGPLVEEMLFRGALFRGLRRRQPPGLTVIGIALLFAAAHRDLRNFAPDFVGGLAMGYVRLVTGSLWPAILVHATFNATSAIYAIVAGPEADMFTRGQNIGAAAGCLGLLLAIGLWARHNALSRDARALDEI